MTARYRTIDLKPRPGEMLKPAELIDVRGQSALTRYARLVYNRLLHNAFGPEIGENDRSFVIELEEIKGSHSGNDRIGDVLTSLQQTIVTVRLSDGRTRQVQLLGGIDFHDDDRTDGTLTYSFDDRLIEILKESYVFGKLELRVLSAFDSKYALALYEAVARRIRMDSAVEEFTIDEFRELLGVPETKLPRYSDLNAYAIKPALEEVNALSDFIVTSRPRKQGRKYIGIIMAWGWKDSEAKKEAWAELRRPRVGRKHRIRQGNTDAII